MLVLSLPKIKIREGSLHDTKKKNKTKSDKSPHLSILKFSNTSVLFCEPPHRIEDWCMGALRGHIGRINWAEVGREKWDASDVEHCWHPLTSEARTKQGFTNSFHAKTRVSLQNLTAHASKVILLWSAVRCFRTHSSVLCGIELLLRAPSIAQRRPVNPTWLLPLWVLILLMGLWLKLVGWGWPYSC